MAGKNTAPPPVEGAMFGDLLGFYGGSNFLLPEGDYIALKHEIAMWSPPNATNAKPKLCVMITFKHRNDPDAEERTEPYSMGTSAHLSWAPNPDTGTGIVPVAGGPASSLPTTSNWGVYLKSLYDSGLDPGVFTNDISVLDGMWVHITHIPEPEERKGFASKTGEAQAQPAQPKKIAVVSLIEEDGKPWEGTGGDVEAAPAKPAVKVNGKVTAIAKPVVKAKAAPEPEPEPQDDEHTTAAVSALGTVLAKTPPTMTRLKLKTDMFKVLNATDPTTAKAIQETFFASDEALNVILGQVGYEVDGTNVKLS